MVTLIEEYLGRTNITGHTRISVYFAEKLWDRIKSIKKVRFGEIYVEMK